MAISDIRSLPVAVTIASASPHETVLVESVLNERFIPKRPELLIGDRAYDSDPLDQKLSRCGMTLIAPHRENQLKTKDAGRSIASEVPETLEGGATPRLASELP
jgi:hypothetical protein